MSRYVVGFNRDALFYREKKIFHSVVEAVEYGKTKVESKYVTSFRVEELEQSAGQRLELDKIVTGSLDKEFLINPEDYPRGLFDLKKAIKDFVNVLTDEHGIVLFEVIDRVIVFGLTTKLEVGGQVCSGKCVVFWEYDLNEDIVITYNRFLTVCDRVCVEKSDMAFSKAAIERGEVCSSDIEALSDDREIHPENMRELLSTANKMLRDRRNVAVKEKEKEDRQLTLLEVKKALEGLIASVGEDKVVRVGLGCVRIVRICGLDVFYFDLVVEVALVEMLKEVCAAEGLCEDCPVQFPFKNGPVWVAKNKKLTNKLLKYMLGSCL